MSATEKEFYGWDDFGSAMESLAKQCRDDGEPPECILAVAPGGLLIGGALSHLLGVKNIISVNVEYYQGNGVLDSRLPEPVFLPPGLDLELLRNKRVLIADDIVDTGKTLEVLVEHIRPVASSVKSAAWFYKGSDIRPDFFATETTSWVMAPWNPHK